MQGILPGALPVTYNCLSSIAMRINFIHNEFQFLEPKKNGSLGDNDFGFYNIANFDINDISCKATFTAGGLTHIANPTWTFSNNKAKEALEEYLEGVDKSAVNKPFNVGFTLQNDEFKPIL
ncbi:hypothetical protein A3K01_01160 [candidate division WWE3 bacterium RIFOXYD1_FULL_43_17]|uniref:Uncharacterized protein n=3 Tax=Katanobacteria TaxID=422282 RepID=A0A1F4XCU7_UNCKA|nr:MAG: hypothetical protein UU59_C0004G0021 [candidate division WWE3 bacterium GW2011_GWE1_41_27]KKS60577.1 MAG: hypothetical protein UV26_C0003G0031 [candidate division WWE3 bacterium GW2011_GWF2_42_42]OGC78913.1 MAG: hypothetical protein A3K01_01160 [candidate division WWE3 bacterium RIFOXYD1_FULL_43_17]